MSHERVDFEKIKALLLSATPEELSKFIRSDKSQDEAMFLFWALDFLDQRLETIPFKSKQFLNKNRDFLSQTQEVIFNESLEFSLKSYSPGFVLGTLEFGIRDREAQINRYKEYLELVTKIQTWDELGFPDEQFKKHWEERINDIEEIQDWMKTRARDWLLAIIPIYRSGRFHKSPDKVLKALRKGRNDNTVFQILAALLHSNPILDQEIKDFCRKNQISVVQKAHLVKVLQLLALKTSDSKVQEYCRLLLNSKGIEGVLI
ncbi:MAG: hypothetical protein ACFFB2_03395 [Promethearchaeota archaeon]